MKKVDCFHFICVLFISAFNTLPGLSQDSSKKYNVLFISTHDMNFRTNFIGNPNGPYLPNLNRLAARGMVFYNNYCQYPFCSPSRTSLLTGWRPDRTGIFGDGIRPRTKVGYEVKFLPEYFGFYGYRTERYGIVTQNNYANDITWDYAEPPESPEKIIPGSTNKEEDAGAWWIDNTPDTLRKNAAWALDLAKRMDDTLQEPFFFALGFNETHASFEPNIANWNKNGDASVQQVLPDKNGNLVYTGNGSANIVLPNTPAGDRNDIPPIAFNIPPVVKTDDDWRNTIHAYYGDASQMDTYVGWVLDKMDQLNLWDNTVVVFWVDHGQHLGEHEGTWLKLTLFEESTRTPFIICVPGKKPGVCYSLTENIDMYATLAELCGLPPPTDVEGSSLAPLFDDPTLPWKRAIFSQVKRGALMGRSVRTEKFHYNNWDTAGEELYDLRTDSFEYTNQVTNVAYANILDSMRTILSEGWTKYLPPKYVLQTFYKDNDKDNYGVTEDSIHAYAKPDGYAINSGDCNDNNASINPGAAEVCDGIDNNCNNRIDEGTARPSIKFNGNTDICTTGSLLLKTNKGIGYTYQWFKDGIIIAGATQQTYLATSEAIYTVRVTEPGGCSRLSNGVTITNSCGSNNLKNTITKNRY